MEIRNTSSLDKEVPNVGFCDVGDVIEVPDDLGESLCLQVDAWERVTPKKKG